MDLDNIENNKKIFDRNLPTFNLLGSPSIQMNQEVTAYDLLPKPSTLGYITLDIIKKLEKAPNIKKAQNKNWALDAGGGSSIFDDFMGFGQD